MTKQIARTISPAVKAVIASDLLTAAEHLVMEVIDWGATPESDRFKLPGAVLIGATTRKISGSKAVQTIIDLLNSGEQRPSPLETLLDFDRSVNYRVEFRDGPPPLEADNPDCPLFYPGHDPRWVIKATCSMVEIVEVFLRGSIVPNPNLS